MRQYVLYSSALHGAVLLALLFFINPAVRNAAVSTVYSIDFVGGPAIIEQPPAPKAAAAKTEIPVSKPAGRISDEIPVKAKKTAARKIAGPLPSPSVLKRFQPPAAAEKTGVEESPSSGGVSAEFPNFPYPWYITLVRAGLWREWSARMPRAGSISAVVSFRIGKMGAAQNVVLEKKSGNKLFDFAALASAEQAGPFPPLPAGYKENELQVHAEFRVVPGE